MEIKNVSDEKINLIRKSLRSMPPKDSTPPMRKIIAKLTREIELTLQKGYTISEVYEQNFKGKLEVSLNTFKEHWKVIKNEALEREKKALEKKQSLETNSASKETEKPPKKEPSKVPASASFIVQPDTPDDEL